MAHSVDFTVPERPVGNVDLEFKVKSNGKMVGRMKVSKGNLHWVPKNAKYGYKLNWRDLDSLMKEYGKAEK